MENAVSCQDAICVGAQLGRLDFVSALLAIIGLVLVLGGIFAFLNFRSLAKKTACEEAEKHAKTTAERVANEYLQAELPDLLQAYKKFLEESGDNTDGESDWDDAADAIADSQEE